MGDRKEWFKLDLSGNVYPTLQKKSFSSTFRVSVTLKDRVDPLVLQKAFEQTIPRFPSLKVDLRTGFFWRYLEPNHRPLPPVEQDVKNPCMPMDFHSKHRYLIRIYYYRNQISLEVFHSLSDGLGAMIFMKTLVAVYLRMKGYEIPNEEGVLDIEEEPKRCELEDAYMKYANSKVTPKRSQGDAYRVRGTREPFYTLNIICGSMSVSQLKETSKKYGVTITEYLNAVLIYALVEKQKMSRVWKEKPVRIAMPVNLRQFFPSTTLRNFISMIYPGVDPRMGEYTFEEILRQVHYYMRYHLNEKFLNADITVNAKTLQSPFIRIVPLFIKDIVVKQFYKRVQDCQSSAGLTNLGVVKLPKEMEEHVERFDVLMGHPFSPRTNCAIISYHGLTTVNFTSGIIESDVERLFFRKLVEDGIEVTIRSNRD